ncbi:divalent metal cation transporter [Duganella sp. S19_KUP01_CR8]|uniref:divalent metal cation transporter n=1 Tax=Duganella sp. S19_KUP01_CR8 TaxID=3025502 RepID=UPI002FCDBD7C
MNMTKPQQTSKQDGYPLMMGIRAISARLGHVKWLTLALLAYIVTALTLKLPWLTLLHDALLPKLSWQAAYITALVAIFGTTISPYLFFRQVPQKIED